MVTEKKTHVRYREFKKLKGEGFTVLYMLWFGSRLYALVRKQGRISLRVYKLYERSLVYRGDIL
jgi:hypothetical protein